MGKRTAFDEVPLHVLALKRFRRSLRPTRLPAALPTKPSFEVVEAASPERGIALYGNVKIVYDEAIMGDGECNALRSGEFEQEEIAVLLGLLREDDRLLDFGTGSGVVALSAAQRVETVVTTVEANPDLLPLIRASIALNGAKVDLIHGIASRAAGETAFEVRTQFAGGSVIETGHAAVRRIATVPHVVFAELLGRVDPTVISMDIEGAEIDLLGRGLAHSRVDRICVELHPAISGPLAIHGMLAELESIGFEVIASAKQDTVVALRRQIH